MRKKYSCRSFLKMTGAGLAGASLLGAAGCGGLGISYSPNADVEAVRRNHSQLHLGEHGSDVGDRRQREEPFTELTGINVKVFQLELSAGAEDGARLRLGRGRLRDGLRRPVPGARALPRAMASSTSSTTTNYSTQRTSTTSSRRNSTPPVSSRTTRRSPRCPTTRRPWSGCTAKTSSRSTAARCRTTSASTRCPAIVDLGAVLPDPTGSTKNQDEVPYGTGHQARQYDSLMCDFSNILWSYGGDYFDSAEIGVWDGQDPGPCTLDEPKAVEAAEFYKKLVHRPPRQRLVGLERHGRGFQDRAGRDGTRSGTSSPPWTRTRPSRR